MGDTILDVVVVYYGQYGDTLAEVSGGKNDSEIQANARLIASAPELLEALVALAECSDPYMVHQQVALDAANATIAKARGQ